MIHKSSFSYLLFGVIGADPGSMHIGGFQGSMEVQINPGLHVLLPIANRQPLSPQQSPFLNPHSSVFVFGSRLNRIGKELMVSDISLSIFYNQL